MAVKKGKRWTLSYVKPSKAETIVPETAVELMDQRREWLNGSFAASVVSSSPSLKWLIFMTLFSMCLSISPGFISLDMEYSACSFYTFRSLCVLHFIHRAELKSLNYCIVQFIFINLFLVCPCQHLVDI